MQYLKPNHTCISISVMKNEKQIEISLLPKVVDLSINSDTLPRLILMLTFKVSYNTFLCRLTVDMNVNKLLKEVRT